MICPSCASNDCEVLEDLMKLTERIIWELTPDNLADIRADAKTLLEKYERGEGK